MKLLYFILLLYTNILSETIKIYLYTPTINSSNFKSIKVNFDLYLCQYGHYELQPFSDKEIFEYYLREQNAIAILSGWHFFEIADRYHLRAHLVATKNGATTDHTVLVGQHNTTLKGSITSAYNNTYAKKILKQISDINHLPLLKVPKEIDALMSVGFGMSTFALVSKDSFLLLQKSNPSLAKNLDIYYESEPNYRIFLSTNIMNEEVKKIIGILKNMEHSENGKNILNLIGIDGLLPFDSASTTNKEMQ